MEKSDKRKSNKNSRNSLLSRDNFLRTAEYSYDFIALLINTITNDCIKVKSIELHWDIADEEKGKSPDVDIIATNGNSYSIILPRTLDDKLIILIR